MSTADKIILMLFQFTFSAFAGYNACAGNWDTAWKLAVLIFLIGAIHEISALREDKN